MQAVFENEGAVGHGRTTLARDRQRLMDVFTPPSLHQDFCKSQQDSQVHSTAPEPILVLRRRHWFHWSAPPGSCWRRRGSAAPKVAPPLGPQAPTPPDAAG